jgi:hypothetical protein
MLAIAIIQSALLPLLRVPCAAPARRSARINLCPNRCMCSVESHSGVIALALLCLEGHAVWTRTREIASMMARDLYKLVSTLVQDQKYPRSLDFCMCDVTACGKYGCVQMLLILCKVKSNAHRREHLRPSMLILPSIQMSQDSHASSIGNFSDDCYHLGQCRFI